MFAVFACQLNIRAVLKKVFLHASVSNEQVLAFAVKDTLAILFDLFMRKQMFLSVLVLEDSIAPIDLASEFSTFQLILNLTIHFNNFALLFAFRTYLIFFKPLIDALPTEKTIAF